MKFIKIEARLSNHKNDKYENRNNLSQGITKRLIEKYKPKGFYDIEALRDKVERKIVA